MAFSKVDVNADCVSSGFGVGLTLSATQNKITFNDKNIRSVQEKVREELKTKLKSAIAATQSKFNTANTKDTKMVEDRSTMEINGYKDPSRLADGNTNSDATNLPKNPEKITLKLKKFDSENPTRYRILIIDEKDKNQSKYDANGMTNNEKGSYIEKQPILVQPTLLKDNNIIELEAPVGTSNPVVVDSKTNVNTNYSTIKIKDAQGTEQTYYIVPKDEDMLDEMTNDDYNPTHALWDDIFTSNSNDKITNAFVNDVIKNDSTLGYKKQFTSDEWLEYNNKTYINTVKHKNLGLSEEIINNTISTLAPNKAQSNTFKDVSKWSFDLGFNVFYQHRIFDWFIRAGLFGNVPIANRTISLVKNSTDNNNNDSKDKKSSSNDISLTHSFDIGAQLLAGYNVTQNFALVFGAEFGYIKYKLNNLNKLSSGYSLNDDKIVEWLAAGSSKDEVLKDYNAQLKNYGLSDNTKEKSFNKWFWRGIVGCEFNLGKCIVGLQAFFGPNITLMKASNSKDFGDLRIVNSGVRANIAFKF